VNMPTGQTDGQMDGRHTVTIRFPLDTASVINDDGGGPTAQIGWLGVRVGGCRVLSLHLSEDLGK